MEYFVRAKIKKRGHTSPPKFPSFFLSFSNCFSHPYYSVLQANRIRNLIPVKAASEYSSRKYPPTEHQLGFLDRVPNIGFVFAAAKSLQSWIAGCLRTSLLFWNFYTKKHALAVGFQSGDALGNGPVQDTGGASVKISQMRPSNCLATDYTYIRYSTTLDIIPSQTLLYFGA